VDDKIRAELQRRNEIDQTMANAIESGRMFLVYQPIVDVEAGILPEPRFCCAAGRRMDR